MSEHAPSLLLVDDDEVFSDVLRRAMEKRGFIVNQARDAEQALQLATEEPPEYAVVDLCMPGASGLVVVKHLQELDAHTRTVVLTGYASVTTAVEAIKLGAMHYLTKPADADEILAAFERDQGDCEIPVETRHMSVNRLEWEHIQRVLTECEGNISAAARKLNMHRRTLQRKLKKRPQKQ